MTASTHRQPRRSLHARFCRCARRGARLLSPLAFLSAALPASAQEGPSLRIREDIGRGELIIELGPLALPAGAGHHEVAQPAAQRARIPLEGWIHGFRIELADRDGNAVPQQVLHHVNVIAPEQRELFSQIMLRVMAAGQETAPAILPKFVGYRVREGQELLVTAAFHNPTPTAYDDVVLRVHMPFTRATAWLAPLSIVPFYMDVMPPASVHAYDLSAGRSERSWEARPAVAGRILGVGGHLHRFGVALRLEDVTAGKVIWEAKPILDDAGGLVGMPVKRFFLRLGVPVRPDHLYRLTAVYENPTGEMIPDGAMGALGGVFLPARGVVWPPADPDHPEYLLDVKIVTDGSYGHGAGASSDSAASGTHHN